MARTRAPFVGSAKRERKIARRRERVWSLRNERGVLASLNFTYFNRLQPSRLGLRNTVTIPPTLP